MGSARTGEDMSASFSDCIYRKFLSFSVLNVDGGSFRSYYFKSTAHLEKFGTKSPKKLHNQRAEQSSFRFVEALNPHIASVVCEAISRRL